MSQNTVSRLLKKEYDALPQNLKEKFERGKLVAEEAEFVPFARLYKKFLQRFGHLSDSTVDMSKPQWRENPQFIISLIKNYKDVSGTQRQVNLDSSGGFSGFMLGRFYRNFVEYEKYSLRLGFLYTYGYSLFRTSFLHIGDILRSKGYISEVNDIFYLTIEEIQRLIRSDRTLPNFSSIIEKRKEEIIRYADIILPEVIFGENPPPVIRKGAISKRLIGLASSRGILRRFG